MDTATDDLLLPPSQRIAPPGPAKASRIAIAFAGLVFLLGSLSAAAAGQVGAANKFRQLTAAQIGALVIGKVITDDAHWADHFYSDGTLKSVQMGETVQGTWRLDGNALCVTRADKRGRRDTECNEVWISNENIEYRRSGTTVAEGIRRGQW